MSADGTVVLKKMLERLMAGLLNGPSMNCRPHASRQRVDLTALAKLGDLDPSAALHTLLGGDEKVTFVARQLQPREEQESPDPEEQQLRSAWIAQQSVLKKLHAIAEDARTYLQDTGVHVLSIGFPLLRLPPGTLSGSTSRRIVAPVAFVPVRLTIRRSAKSSVDISCCGEGVDRVMPNTALLSWLDQVQKQVTPPLFEDEEGAHPWHEIGELVRLVCARLEIDIPAPFDRSDQLPEWRPARDELQLRPAPKADEGPDRIEIVPSAVIGLYPMANQGLINDTRALVDGEPYSGPIESFLKVDAGFYEDQIRSPEEESEQLSTKRARNLQDERLVSQADPCQARAVTMARTSKGLVVHGPPGTGKSQTITNVIGDHLARGERVLFVCEKRTALDVVAHRLDHLGLNDLVAVVHDPQRDQRDLYRAIRGQIDSLSEARLPQGADRELDRVDRELVNLHATLGAYRHALMDSPGEGALSLHRLMGDWLGLPETVWKLGPEIPKVAYEEFRSRTTELDELFKRAVHCGLISNPWRHVVSTDLQSFLQRPMSELRGSLAALVDQAKQTDATADKRIPPFAAQPAPGLQGTRRNELAKRLEEVVNSTSPEARALWKDSDAAAGSRARQRLAEIEPIVNRIGTPMDVELVMTVQGQTPIIQKIVQQLAAVVGYLEVSGKWHAFMQFGRKKAAAEVLRSYGLQLGPETAARLRTFLEALKDRLIVSQIYSELRIFVAGPGQLVPDDEISSRAAEHRMILALICDVDADAWLNSLASEVRAALSDPAKSEVLQEGLRLASQRGSAIDAMVASVASEPIFPRTWVRRLAGSLLKGQRVADKFAALNDSIDTVEDVIRTLEAIAHLPPALGQAAQLLIDAGAEPGESLAALRKAVVAGEISRRLAANPQLQQLDERQLQAAFDRYRQLDADKKSLVRDSILHRWLELQKKRLLASTGNRLNGDGAKLKTRFIMRGQRATRLRKAIEIGRAQGDDPLFDLRPIWMASPETVAELFPREAMFDVVIFDEASQCRLEEALPVLLRAKRLVIAGDPQQLPPTRFFESAVIVSEDDDNADTDQALFESRQSQMEDLLSAALNLQVDEAYLDVHYRSRNSDLIEFSNEHFYRKRLQTIPGHPRNFTRYAPLTVEQVNGVYDKGTNEIESQRVCGLVRELLRRAEPPSIGIASFNVMQRDLILEKLEDLASEDGEFGRRFAEARARVGRDSFEGLFVKNLENVQGDERDHIIISTTYGPDPKGKFYRRFGPLLRAGGGRRLNVLVTRARHEVHLITSIPPEAYRTVPPVPPGMVAGGGWLLFAYLHFAERLGEEYEVARRVLDQTAAQTEANVEVRPTERPSQFSVALARRLASERKFGSTVHWGNDGFCVDVALAHPQRAEDVTIGILCDATRFDQAQDMVEWDIFRTAIHESQGWKIHRIWTPHFFRDPQRHCEVIATSVREFLTAEPPADSLAVRPT